MMSLVSRILAALASGLRSRLDLIFEHLALSHQLMVMQRSYRRPQFRGADRCLWILLPLVWERWPTVLVIVKPETVRRWRRMGVWKCWRGRGRKTLGRPPINAQLVALIKR
jgi:hypothetical protein